MTDPQIQSGPTIKIILTFRHPFLEINDPLLADQQVVEKVNQKRFGELLPKNTLKANVRKGIDVICHS